jgi:hypothetical protein
MSQKRGGARPGSTILPPMGGRTFPLPAGPLRSRPLLEAAATSGAAIVRARPFRYLGVPGPAFARCRLLAWRACFALVDRVPRAVLIAVLLAVLALVDIAIGARVDIAAAALAGVA